MIAAGGLPRLTPKSITNPEALKRELALVRAMEYAVSAKENRVGVRGGTDRRSHAPQIRSTLLSLERG